MTGWASMLRCSDGSFYVGSTSHEDVETRVGEHNEGIFGGYTSKRRPVSLVWAEWFSDLREAHVAERRIKGWSRAKKQALIARDFDAIRSLAKRPGARGSRRGRHPEALAKRASKDGRAPHHDACFEAPLRGAPQHDAEDNRHPEVRAKRASKDDEAGGTA